MVNILSRFSFSNEAIKKIVINHSLCTIKCLSKTIYVGDLVTPGSN